MERQSKALNTVMDEVDILRRNVEQFKIGKGDEPDAVAEWGAELDGEIKETDEAGCQSGWQDWDFPQLVNALKL